MKTMTMQPFAAFVGIDWADTKHDVCICASSKDSGLKGIVFRRDFQLIRFMFMQPSACSIADVSQPVFSA